MANRKRPSSERHPEHGSLPVRDTSNRPSAPGRESPPRAEVPREATQTTWTRRTGEEDAGGLVAATVRDVMTSNPTTLSSSDPIREAARAMRDVNIGDVLVADKGKIVGILTDRDIVIRLLADDLDPRHTSVGEICSREMQTLGPDDAIEAAMTTMRKHAVRRLPVVKDGQPVGIVSLGDLAQERDPRSVLGEISAAPANQ
jgi:CBS domain-containing protein